MPKNTPEPYTQSLLDRIISLTAETNNLRSAYVVVISRLNKLSSLAEQRSRELFEEATKVEDFARLAVEATKLTEKSALITNNTEVIEAAKNSSEAAREVHELAVELRTVKLAKLKSAFP